MFRFSVMFIVMLTLGLCGTAAHSEVTPEPTPVLPYDDSLLTQQPCAFPCWYGIVPGESTFDDVREVLQNLMFYIDAQHKSEDVVIQSPRGNRVIGWWSKSPSERNSIWFTDDLVSSIMITPNIDFTLSDILKLYGEPAGVQFHLEAGSEIVHYWARMNIYYPKQGLVAVFELLNQQGGDAPEQIAIQDSAVGIAFWLYPATSTFPEFIPTFRPDFDIAMLEGWPGIGSLIIPSTSFNYGFPTIKMADGETCCPVEYSKTLPRWRIFVLPTDP